MRVIINPGTEPCDGATSRQATRNMRAFAYAVEERLIAVGQGVLTPLHAHRRPKRDYGNGRYAYVLRAEADNSPQCEVQMPGLPLEALCDDESIWQPRIYVDGNSWHWKFAVQIAASYLVGEDE